MKQQNHFGRAFRTVRLARSLTQEDFAHESGRTYISELERGLKQPTLKKIDGLAAQLAVHPLTPLVLAYLNEDDIQSLQELLELVQDELIKIMESSVAHR
jgi:transcriptional regulator with XRE-family HTH domain